MSEKKSQSRRADRKAGAKSTPDDDSKVKPIGLAAKLRGYFLTGVLITSPLSITIYLAWLIVDFVDSRVTPLIPAKYNPENYLPFSLPGLGLIVMVVVMILIGALTAGYLGRLFIRTSERIVHRTPFIRSIYGAVKQIIETMLSQQSTSFRQVALIEWPRDGMWALGFITNHYQGEVQEKLDMDLYSVLLPTTPNPTSGWLMFVPRDKVIILDMSVEEGMKMAISGGIVVPGQMPGEIEAPGVPPIAPPRAKPVADEGAS